MNILADVPISLIGETFDISLNWIGKLVKLLISSGVGVGLGIILFSLVLKVIVLPFDIFQRISMRKQNIRMKENKDKMEKLQKQYANDKQMYNQKVMEMQKQNGFSILSSCLPMILSLVIFFIAIGAFNAYAKFSTVDNYNTLANAYGDAVKEYVVDLDSAEYGVEVKDVTLPANAETGTPETTVKQYSIVVKANSETDTENKKLIYFRLPITEERAATLTTEALMKAEVEGTDSGARKYYIDVEKAAVYEETKALIEGKTDETQIETTLKDFFDKKGAEAAAVSYEKVVAPKTKFLWIKNVWATDASYKHPVLSHEDFLSDLAASSCGSSCSSNGRFLIGDEEVTVGQNGELVLNNIEMTNVYEEETYNKVTRNLGEQKDQANGYFILIVLSIGTILLQQVIMQRSQKEQQQYSSVDGQGASQQKMMMITMTIMFGVFSFLYSSAFSIYMIVSNVFSLVSTLIINKFVDMAEEKKEQKALQEKYNKRLPRTGRTSNQTTDKTQKGKGNKKGK